MPVTHIDRSEGCPLGDLPRLNSALYTAGDTCPLRIDPGRLALGGFSAGANIAAAAAQLVTADNSL